MTEDQKIQIRSMLLDIIENSKKPNDFKGSQANFKRDWLLAVSAEAAALAKEVQA